VTSYSAEVTINVQTAVPLLGHRARSVFSIRWARATVEFLRREIPAFIPPDRWPANQQPRPQPCRRLHLGPCTASCIAEASERCGSTEAAPDQRSWSGLQQTVVDEAIDKWRRRPAGVCPSKGAAVWTFTVTSDYDVANQQFKFCWHYNV